MLTKDLLRVSRAGGGFHPQFVGREDRPLAARVLGVFQGHVGERRERLDDALDDLEGEAEDFKLVRGLAALLEREATFETRAAIPPERARRATFEAAEAVGVVTQAERREALDRAADRLGVDATDAEEALYADREPRQVLAAFDPRWDPDGLLEQYNLSLAQTALFDATEVRVRSSDPKALVSAVKRLGLMYDVKRVAGSERREVVVTGPDALFRRTRRYGTAFARLLRTVATAADWTLEATVDDRGTERTLELDGAQVSVPEAEPVAEVTFDSGVEADFAARFSGLDLDWTLTREPEPLATGSGVMIPDFAFDYDPAPARDAGRDGDAGATSGDRDGGVGDGTPADDGDRAAGDLSVRDVADPEPVFRVYFEVMGFWTPEYVEKKLDQLAGVEDVELLVAVDESLGVGEEIEDRSHRVVAYRDAVRVKDVVDVLREYERDLVAAAAADLPGELTPAEDVITIESLAARHGVAAAAIEDKTFPDHERVGRTLVRPAVLAELREALEPGASLSEAEVVLDEYGIDDASAALSALGYRVEWEGLGGGVLREKD